MAILSKGTTYSDGDQVTSTNLNALVDSATFASGAVDDSTTQLSTGKIVVKDLGIATGKIAASAVTTAKIADSNVTKAKIENVANLKVLGNVSGSAAAPAEVAILDEDNMASNSATSLATQQSIKAYADSKVDGTGAGSFTTLAASGDVTFDTTTLKVDSSNNRVGILTASPAVPLDVNGQARVVGNLFVGTDDTTPNGMIEVYGGGTGQNEGGEIRLRTAADFDTTYNHYFIDAYQDDLRIGREGGADITLTSDGNVGIGTASPAHKLDVNGTGRFTGVLSAGSNLEVSGTIKESVDNGNLVLQGGGSGGANIELYGTSHSSAPNGANYDANIHRFRPVDGSANSLNIIQNGNVGIGVDTPSAPLTVTSTTGGVIMPRMTTTQMNAISSPANGEMIYNTTANKFYGYANGAWVALH